MQALRYVGEPSHDLIRYKSTVGEPSEIQPWGDLDPLPDDLVPYTPLSDEVLRAGLPPTGPFTLADLRVRTHSFSLVASQPRMQVCRLTSQSRATSVTVRPPLRTAMTALYRCSPTLSSFMRGSVKHQPKPL
jgi:hypothetical protein